MVVEGSRGEPNQPYMAYGMCEWPRVVYVQQAPIAYGVYMAVQGS